MKARTRNAVSLLALLVIASGAVAYAYYGVEKKSQQVAKKDLDAKKLFTLEPDKVSELTVDRTASGGQKVRVVRDEKAEWKVVEPMQTGGDKAPIEAVVTNVLGLVGESVVAPADAPAADLARFGLGKPSIRISLKDKDGASEALEVGDISSFDTMLYVRKSGGPVVQAKDVKFMLDKTLFDLRDKRLMPIEDEKQIKRIEAKGAKFAYVVEREGKGWKMLSPKVDRADEVTVNRMILTLKVLRANSFVPDPKSDKEYGLDKPAITVRVTTTQGVVHAFVVGAPTRHSAPKDKSAGPDGSAPVEQASHYARIGSNREIMNLFDFSLTDLDVDVPTLEDKAVVSFESSQASALHFESGKDVVELQKKADASGRESWNITSPRAAPANRFKVPTLMFTLAALRGTRLVDAAGKDAARYGLDHPTRMGYVLGPDGKELGRIEVGADAPNNKVYVRGSAGGPRIFEIDRSKLNDMPRSIDEIIETDTQPGAKKK